MKLTIQRTDLTELLDTVSPACPSRPTLPVLACVSLAANADELIARTCDLERQISANCPAVIKDNGVALVPFAKLRAIVKECGGETVAIESDAKGNVCLVSGDYTVELMGLPPDESFPEMDAPTCDPIDGDGGVLLNALKAVQDAQSNDVTRYVLNGVCIERHNGLTTVATDGRRLAVCGDIAAKAAASAIIPTPAVDCALKLLADGSPYALRIGDKAFSLTTPAGVLVGKLVEGAYPNWRQVIPAAGESGATVDCAALAESVHRVALVNPGSCRLDIGKAGVRVSAIGADVGKAADVCDGTLFGRAVAVSVNPEYLRDALKAASMFAPTARMDVRDTTAPVLISAGDSFRAVVMPMRIGEEVAQ